MPINRKYTIPTLTRNDVNLELLNTELTALGEIGLSWSPSAKQWIVTIKSDVTDSAIQAVIDAHDKNTLTDNQIEYSAVTTIKGLRTIAISNAPFISSLMVWCLNADLNSDDSATRFTNLVATFTGQPSGVINRFKSGVIAEYDIDIDEIGIGSLSDAQKRDIIRFARSFANSWAIALV